MPLGVRLVVAESSPEAVSFAEAEDFVGRVLFGKGVGLVLVGTGEAELRDGAKLVRDAAAKARFAEAEVPRSAKEVTDLRPALALGGDLDKGDAVAYTADGALHAALSSATRRATRLTSAGAVSRLPAAAAARALAAAGDAADVPLRWVADVPVGADDLPPGWRARRWEEREGSGVQVVVAAPPVALVGAEDLYAEPAGLAMLHEWVGAAHAGCLGEARGQSSTVCDEGAPSAAAWGGGPGAWAADGGERVVATCRFDGLVVPRHAAALAAALHESVERGAAEWGALTVWAHRHAPVVAPGARAGAGDADASFANAGRLRALTLVALPRGAWLLFDAAGPPLTGGV